ncbi:hypothetical protein T458_14720 [Brevibacillus panacihumi W25]|uniref:Uncharacterized protein n=1 Tax=Brevibacillus panacihumi W25 TaxID=1408254 RepID=V6M8P4_9BACL|nr:hypothetical protein T458_14720 [Brevibacillus panacihumi W25]
MLKMPQQHYIRFLREVEECSVNEIAERVGVHWRTAKKYTDQTDWNASMKKRKGRSPVMVRLWRSSIRGWRRTVWSPVSSDTQVCAFSNVCATNINLLVGNVQYWPTCSDERMKWNWIVPKRTNG